MSLKCRRTLPLTALWMLICSNGSAAAIEGAWSLTKISSQPAFRIDLHREGVIVDPSRSLRVTLAELAGLTAAQASSAYAAVEFQLVRDAGKLAFTGEIRNGAGEGKFRFGENPAFVAELRTILLDWTNSEKVYDMALRGVSLSFVQRLQSAGYKQIYGLDLLLLHTNEAPIPSEIRLPTAKGALRDGPRNLLPGDAALLRRYGITAEQMKQLQQSGYPLLTEDVIRLHFNGVSPDLLRQMKTSGYENASVSDLIKLQNHGVTAQDIQYYEIRGQKNLTADDIVKLKNNGIQ